MEKKIETNVKDLDKNEEVERRVMCAVGLLYQKIDGTQYTNKVRVCFVDYAAGDFDLTGWQSHPKGEDSDQRKRGYKNEKAP